MSDKPKLPENISQALQLDGSSKAIREYYAKWSETYDSDLQGDHVAPLHMVNVLVRWLAEHRPQSELAKYRVIDVGCGTGLVGAVLKNQGFKIIDGVDLSPEMIDKARGLGIYRELTADVDINLNSHSRWRNQYDIVICCGVFTLGHVRPESLNNMLQFAKPGGLVMTSTRQAYYESTNYQQVSDAAVASGDASLVLHIENAPYTRDSDAHYWLYQIS
ncbi:MAG: methyltransferase domain-containing protein [Arenicella sp.]|nr:methyltransferase domain-containing protein [Arenicella sp.]